MSRTLAIALALATAVAGHVVQADSVLIRHDFDGAQIETGPWLTAFEFAEGRVELTTEVRYSGERSVTITDVAGDGNFAELQGFFPRHASGSLNFSFALMTAEPEEELNIAFAGPQYFNTKPDGIALWFKSVDGTLTQLSDGAWTPLFKLQRFTWYRFSIDYDVTEGRYALKVWEERADEPFLVTEPLPNAIGKRRSAVDKFSFIGGEPGRDNSNVVFYLDDIVIAGDAKRKPGEYVAPGRRTLFVHAYDYYRKRLYTRPSCPPVAGPEDFGLDAYDVRELKTAGHGELYHRLASGLPLEAGVPDGLGPHVTTALSAMVRWQQGCAIARKSSNKRLRLLRQASAQSRDGKIFKMSELLALVARREWEAVDTTLASIYPDWHDDPRFPALSATIGVARDDLVEAQAWLDRVESLPPSEAEVESIRRLWSGEVSSSVLEQLREQLPDTWPEQLRQALILDQRFDVLLWQEKFEEAADYAGRMAKVLGSMGLSTSRWHERRGDVAFFVDDFESARTHYERGLLESTDSMALMLKLSDVHFLTGDLEQERRYRELIFGSLKPAVP